MSSDLIGRLRAEYATYEAQFSEQSRSFGDNWPGMQTLRSKLDQAWERLQLETQRIAEQVRDRRESEYPPGAGGSRPARRAAAPARGRGPEAAARLGRVRQPAERGQEEARDPRRPAAATERDGALDPAAGSRRHLRQRQDRRARPGPRLPLQPQDDEERPRRLAARFDVRPRAGLPCSTTLDNTVSTAAELEALVPAPVLAVIPRHGAAEAGLSRVRRKPSGATPSIDLVAHLNGRSRAAEAYRGLRTSILLSSAGRPPRRILITSAIPEEGKTATTLNLGIVLAQLGRRVVVVDTDLRRPRLHLALDLSNRFGASTFLSGMEKDPARLIQPTSVEHLYFIASGPVPPNPSELLNSPIFSRLATELLEQGFDHVLFRLPSRALRVRPRDRLGQRRRGDRRGPGGGDAAAIDPRRGRAAGPGRHRPARRGVQSLRRPGPRHRIRELRLRLALPLDRRGHRIVPLDG